jgi:hypothetical protein
MMRDKNVDKIRGGLYRITMQGGECNFMCVVGDKERNYYVQCTGEHGNPCLLAEAVSNAFLEPENALNEAQMSQLKAIGWEENPYQDEGNFQLHWEAESDEQRHVLAELVVQTLIDVYGVSPEYELDIEVCLD